MKKIFLAFVAILLLLTNQVVAAPWSATLTDVAGTYNLSINSKFKVNKVRSKVVADSTGQMTLSTDGITGTFVLDVDSPVMSVAGGFELISKGKKILLSPTDLDELKAVLSNWLTSLVANSNPEVVLGSIVFDIQSVKVSKVKIDKTTKKAVKKITATIKGIVYVEGTDDVGGFEDHSKFTYTAKINIQ